MANLTLGDFYNAIREGAREATLEALAEVDFSTSSKQDTIKSVLDTLATESTLGNVKTATEALAALIDSGALKTTLTGRTNANDPIAARLTDGTNYIGTSNPLPIREPAPTAIIRENPGGAFTAGATVTVFSDVDVSAYRQVWAVARATVNANYTITIRRVGYNSSGSTGGAERGSVVSKDSGNTSLVSTGVVYPEAPRVSVTLTNNGASSIAVDVALGGVR